MAKFDDVYYELWGTTEFIAITTNGEDGPHVVGNWGDYVRKLGLRDETIVMPAGSYHQTEKNLSLDNRVSLLIASRQVHGSRTPGQGCKITGTGEIVTTGAIVDEVKELFPWARGALVISVEKVTTQL